MTVTLYNVTSRDGFIARLDGSEDFIPDELWDFFISLFKNYDGVAISRKTYEAIQRYEPQELKKFEDTEIKKIVVSRDSAFSVKLGYMLVHSPEEAQELASRLLVSSGAGLNDSFLKSGLVAEVHTYELPVVLGRGIRRFSTDPKLVLESQKQTPFGTYNIARYSAETVQG